MLIYAETYSAKSVANTGQNFCATAPLMTGKLIKSLFPFAYGPRHLTSDLTCRRFLGISAEGIARETSFTFGECEIM